MKRFPLLIVLGCWALCCCGQISLPALTTTDSIPTPTSDRMIPAIKQGETIVNHNSFSLLYSENDEQPVWVAYMLTRQRSNGDVPRTNNFREDDAIITGSAELADYRGSGYTRGHLVPAGDMKWNYEAMDETFLLSNMSPQLADFNDGIWNRAEQQVRTWSRRYDTIFVVTGPILNDPDLEQIGPNCVTVPKRFYKAVYAPAIHQTIAFVIPHQESNAPLSSFAISVDELESITGLDFFPQLPDDEEESMESDLCTTCWKLK